MDIRFVTQDLPQDGVVVVGVQEERELTTSGRLLDVELEGALARAMQASRFRGKKDQTLSLAGIAPFARILLLGMGKPDAIDPLRAQAAGGQVWTALAAHGHLSAHIAVDAIDGCALAPAELAAEMAYGAVLRSYRFAKYMTRESEDERPSLTELVFGCADPSRAAALFQRKQAVAEAVFFTRNLVSEPANVIYP
jgi:leucyl aminopeptidase